MSMCVMEMLEQSPTLLNIASSPSRQILIYIYNTPGCRTDVRHAASAMLIAAGRTGLACQQRMHTPRQREQLERLIRPRNNTARSQVPGTARMSEPTAAAPQSAPRPYLTRSMN